MVGGHGGSSFGGQFVKLAGGDAFVNAGADFLSDQNGVAVIGAEAITKLLEARGYFVEVNRLLPPVPLYHVHFFFFCVLSGDGLVGFEMGSETDRFGACKIRDNGVNI